MKKLPIYFSSKRGPLEAKVLTKNVGHSFLKITILSRKMSFKRKQFDELSRSQKFRRIKSANKLKSDLTVNSKDESDTFSISEENCTTCEISSDNSIDSFNIENKSSKESSENMDSSSSLSSNYSVDELEFLTENSISNIVTDKCNGMCDKNLKNVLRNWSITENISNDSISRLLVDLREFFPSLPKTSKTLKSSKPTYEIYTMDKGEYVHFNLWIFNLISLLDIYLPQNAKRINLSVNVDGIPIYSNSRYYSIYPILVRALECPQKIFTVGIFCTNDISKTLPSPEIFLKQFINDIANLNGILNTNKYNIPIKLGPFIADAPMRAYLKQIVSHTAYSSCERCIQKGEYHGGHVVLTKDNAELRTKYSFKTRKDVSHHKSHNISPLELAFDLDMVDTFILDYMHLTTIGVMKRLLLRLNKSTGNQKKCHLSRNEKEILEERLCLFSKHIPSDFPRKLESGFRNISRWKATEYRLMMLYVGIVLFNNKNIMKQSYYENFLLFSVSMRLLLSENMEVDMENVKLMLKTFVHQSSILYGKEFVSYNIHSLLHLPEDYLNFGNLEKISAFPFESFLGKHIKAVVKSGYKPLQQISKHIMYINEDIPKIIQESIQTSAISEKRELLSIKYKGFIIKTGGLGGRDNNVLLQNSKAAIVSRIISDGRSTIIEVQTFKKMSPFFEKPCDSTSMNIFKVKKLNEKCMLDINEIYCKVILLPHKSSYVVLPLLHTI